ncbi:glutathione S-transferase family protein [Acidimangrovimonas pyrenivorans]|uniref:Glutathione S-transferase family protein n=1 Tax=Acidimangrovimonas pyrenivorans TaxID=2030798 RepID=A0ABV7ACF3_9RHOB
MYLLHYAPDNASLIVRLALEELGAPYQTRLVDRAAREQEGAAYRALNPAGLIPVLETADGPIFETGAILLWLSERHGALAPAPLDPARGAFLKWLFFTANTLHADLRQLFYPERYAPPGCEAGFHAIAGRRIARHFGLLDVVAAEAPDWLSPEAPSVLSCYLAGLMRWAALYPRGGTGWFRLDDTPALKTLAEAAEARPAARRCAEAEGLGPTPFSAPGYAEPPEGSAT